jgi:hypothetical protein
LGKRTTDDPTPRQTAHFPPDLQQLIDSWADLREPIRIAILELVHGRFSAER